MDDLIHENDKNYIPGKFGVYINSEASSGAFWFLYLHSLMVSVVNII